MTRFIHWVMIVALATGGCAGFNLSSSSSESAAPATTARVIQSFDSDWRFLKSDADGAEKVSFADAGWRKLDVPHDWSIEGPYDQNAPTRGSGGSLPAGIGWYRKTFTLAADQADRHFFIEFDGVMANSEVWINGQSLGKRPFGYSSFRYEMTGHLKFGPGTSNVLAVRADNSQQPASRWYAGAGIYRHVRMISTAPTYVEQWATFITTPQVAADRATVRVQTTVANRQNAAAQLSIQTSIIAPDGSTVASGETSAQSVESGKSAEFQQEINVTNPKLWNVESPNLYRAVTSVRSGGKTVDDDVNTFGIRNFEFKTESGFWLNGKNFKLLGVCLHSDGGAVGMAVPLGVWEHRFNALRELGVNAIRTAHNPPDPAFLDLCDRMGFLVMDETFDCWTVGKNTYDYHVYFKDWNLIDTRDMVKRDRNHPSIILYSTGNEIHDTPREELAKSLLKPMVDEVHKWDPTRPVTQALFRPNVSHDYTNGLADMLDVVGTNYRDAELIQAWKDKPGRKIVGTEQQLGLDTWLNLRDNPQHSGQFLWAGIDYLGEVQWPETTYFNGLLDRLGQMKPQGWERQAWWGTKPMVKIVRTDAAPGGGGRRGAGRGAATQNVPDGGLGNAGADPAPGARRGAAPAAAGGQGRGGPVSSWSLREGTPAPQTTVTVYSNCEEVELFINDKSLGVKNKPANDASRTWNTTYENGTIRAVGKNKGQVAATDELRTAGKPAKIILTTSRDRIAPTFDDVSFITATVVDEKGVRNPNADDRIAFNITGPGFVAAVDNADRVDHDPYQATDRKAYQGQAVAIVKSNASSGSITIKASAAGLTDASITIQAASVKTR